MILNSYCDQLSCVRNHRKTINSQYKKTIMHSISIVTVRVAEQEMKKCLQKVYRVFDIHHNKYYP